LWFWCKRGYRETAGGSTSSRIQSDGSHLRMLRILNASNVRAAARLANSKTSTLRTTPHGVTQRAFTTVKSAPKSRTTTFTFSSHPRTPPTILQRLRSLRFFHNSKIRRDGKPTSPDPTPNLNSPKGEPEPQTLGARMRKLSREYGWSAVGVYAGLTALDFPFCYLLVRSLGTDRIGEWEEVVVSNIKKVIPESFQNSWHEWRESMRQARMQVPGGEQVGEGIEMAGWGVEEADKMNKVEASLGTQLALAYAIHKSFIFIRVPLTVALTPKIVKVLRGWGWDIGKRTTKEAKAIKRAAISTKPKKS